MKVAVLSPIAWRTPPEHYGPWEQMASNLTEELIKLDIKVTLFATGDSITSGTLNAVIDKGYEYDKNKDAKVVECLHISNLMEHANEFDIIHNHFDFLPLTYSKLIKTPLITTIHGFSSEKIIPVYKKYNDNCHFVSISDSDRHSSLKYLATVFNGLNVNDFRLNENPEDYLLFFGRIHPDKGTVEAIEIAKRSNRKLKIAGIIQDSNYFEKNVKPHLNDDIQFLGHLGPESRNKLMGNASALLHPISFNEPFGLSVVEAMMCGTPVIAFNRGSMPELIQHQKNGFLANDVSESVEAISKLPSINRKNCSINAKEKFSSTKMAKEYLKLYKKILGT
ncbi:MAG: glycosyltransferase family 4 protein [Bacteroidetes bacterium]|nr:glycosyltransferase family 4 protein [Bacteroidota bacterium]MBU1371626.1 glycosyltransferase family 4 protein [Bacteroidota bacterium]MBU1486202.1 glycosyltransferase family 4 protein [Bacteroidota bacterium]MBU1761959.1 glycosyltransferase family 4 protein [Bacteroidota bacterium]MBU2269462.1 glycosyltransferase family 4 protein [Bacteroidota bacterium]